MKLNKLKMLLPSPVKAIVKNRLIRASMSLSQAGQDLWVAWEGFNEKTGGFFVDVGAHDGVHLSNTYVLEKRYGWNGLCIEANPKTFAELRRNRTAACLNVCLDAAEGSVTFAARGEMGGIVSATTDNNGKAGILLTLPTRPLNAVLDEAGAPRSIDYLTMDIEGAEDRVFSTFDFNRHTFKCMTIERPSPSLRETLARNGYILIKDIPSLDAFYVHQSHSEEYLTNVYRVYAKKRLMFRWS